MKTVYCEASDILQNGIGDIANIHIAFENGLKGHVFCSWLYPYKEQKLVIIGDKATAVFDDTMDWSQKLAIYDHVINMNETPPVPQKSEVKYMKVPQGEPLKAECQYFLNLIDRQVDPLTDGAEGRRVLQVLAAASASIESGEKYMPDYSERFEGVFVHESSYVDDGVEIGSGTKIWHFSHILGNTQIGKNCSLGQNVVVGPNVSIGNKVKIQNNVSVYDGVTLEDGVFCGPSCVFTNVHNPRSEITRKTNIGKPWYAAGLQLAPMQQLFAGMIWVLIVSSQLVRR